MHDSPWMHDLSYLAPWEFSPTVALSCAAAVIFYLRGLRAQGGSAAAPRWWHTLFFLLGIALIYFVMQTRYDYFSQHMFWVHRLQHLVLHHLAPFLVALAVPGPTLRRGLPASWRAALERSTSGRWWRGTIRFLQHPLVAGLLFVGLIFFWLTPSIHFGAMLDARRYRMMNWSMVLDGLLFWWLVLTPRALQGQVSIRYIHRALMLVGVTVPQLLLGAHIALHKSVMFDVYDICGRAWNISALRDQQIGGLLTWIPPAMMSLLGLLIVFHLIFRDAAAGRAASRSALAPARGTG